VQVHYGEGVANHTDPESCAASRASFNPCSMERDLSIRRYLALSALCCFWSRELLASFQRGEPHGLMLAKTPLTQ